ncbi:MAG: hypothetical protein ACI4OY_12455, partial [Aristaeellaceae bacterium]
MSVLTHLRTENRRDPLNIDTPRPVFSWRVESTAANWMQENYRLQVWQGDTPVWDSGAVASPRMNQIEYAGAPLAPETAYRWQVSVTARSDAGREELTSPEARFETAMLAPEDWQGQWIGENQDEVYHLFRRAFHV